MPAPKQRGPKPGTVKWAGMGEEEFALPVAMLDGVHQALAHTDCARCGRAIPKGEWAFKDDGRTVGVNCCGSKADVRVPGASLDSYGELDDDVEGRDFVPLSQVMPANRSKADMCRSCFQIPSASGVCGC